MIALPGQDGIHARAVADAADRAARDATRRALIAPRPRTSHTIDARDLRPGDVITRDDGTPVHTVRDVTDVDGRVNIARVWTMLGQPITYSGTVTVTRPTA